MQRSPLHAKQLQLIALAHAVQAAMLPENLDVGLGYARTLAEVVDEAIRGGVTFVQLREKELDPADLLNEARLILSVCRKHHVPLIINDDPEIARKCGADGVHVGQKDLSPRILRSMLGPDKIVGVSAATVAEAV